MASWDVVTALEIDKNAATTYVKNFPNTNMVLADVSTVDFQQFQGIDLLAGGPPCQPFSVAGKQKASADLRNMIPQYHNSGILSTYYVRLLKAQMVGHKFACNPFN